jgi:hypothetical protein
MAGAFESTIRPDKFAACIRSKIAKWAKVVQASGVKRE